MRRTLTLTAAALASFAGAAAAQEAKPQEPAPRPAESQPEKPPPEKPQPERPAQPPSLDELLGLTPEKKPAPTKPLPEPQDPTKAALERKLSNQEVSEAFLQAVRLMGDTAARLEQSRDTSITTQRMQEDVIRKLDILISQAEKQQQQQQQQQQSQKQNQDPSQQPQQQQQGQNQGQPQNGDPQQSSDPPGRREGPLGPEMAQGAAWGSLPARVRDALLQGNADKYSSMYQKWTEAYYRRIAEEAGR